MAFELLILIPTVCGNWGVVRTKVLAFAAQKRRGVEPIYMPAPKPIGLAETPFTRIIVIQDGGALRCCLRPELGAHP